MSAGTADRSVAEIRHPAGYGPAAGLSCRANPNLERPRKEMGSSMSGSGKPAGSPAGVGTHVCSGQTRSHSLDELAQPLSVRRCRQALDDVSLVADQADIRARSAGSGPGTCGWRSSSACSAPARRRLRRTFASTRRVTPTSQPSSTPRGMSRWRRHAIAYARPRRRRRPHATPSIGHTRQRVGRSPGRALRSPRGASVRDARKCNSTASGDPTAGAKGSLPPQTLAADDEQAPAVARRELLPLLHLWRAVARPLTARTHATRHSARRAAFAPLRCSFRTGRLLGRAAIQLSTACSGRESARQPRGDSGVRWRAPRHDVPPHVPPSVLELRDAEEKSLQILEPSAGLEPATPSLPSTRGLLPGVAGSVKSLHVAVSPTRGPALLLPDVAVQRFLTASMPRLKRARSSSRRLS
jgi:hypothetical protein